MGGESLQLSAVTASLVMRVEMPDNTVVELEVGRVVNADVSATTSTVTDFDIDIDVRLSGRLAAKELCTFRVIDPAPVEQGRAGGGS